jgi:hypothetical protein
MRCQDVELFVKSLYMRQVGRLVAPSTHRGIDLVMAWINRAYGHREARHGRRRTVRVGGEWSVGRVLMEPLFYNPHGAESLLGTESLMCATVRKSRF